MPVLGDGLSFESDAVNAFEDLRASKLSWVSWTFHNTMQVRATVYKTFDYLFFLHSFSMIICVWQRGKLQATGERIHDGKHPYQRLYSIRRKRNTKVITREKILQMKKEVCVHTRPMVSNTYIWIRRTCSLLQVLITVIFIIFNML